MREQGRWPMACPPALWSDPPFPASPVHGLMNFPLEKCLCLVMSSMTGASAVTDSLPPPSWHRISASLFPAPHPELTNVWCASAQVPHHGRNRFYWPLHPCHRGRQLVSNTVCWSQKFSWALFQTQEIFIKSSSIFWVHHFGYIFDRSKLKTVICNQNHTFSREI